jgi:esterase/lipase superfamily enzyme
MRAGLCDSLTAMTDTNRLVLALLGIAEELTLLLGDAWPPVRDALATLAPGIDADTDSMDRRHQVDALLERLLASPARSLVQEALKGTITGGVVVSIRRGLDFPIAGAPPVEPPRVMVTIPVYFGTDRAEDENASVEDRYSGARGELGFGVAQVSVPPTHVPGEVEAPKWWHLEFRPDPQKHVVLHSIDRLSADAFVTALSSALSESSARDVLLYVHGYNVGFADSARRTAQLACDLRFPGRTVLYSWPAKNKTLGYMADEATVEWTTPHFEAFLTMVLTGLGAKTVHVLAHSMGNRAVVRTLERFNSRALPPTAATLHNVIFAAPDVDRDVFLQIAAHFDPAARCHTLYASSTDAALNLSKTMHEGPRAGDGGPPPLIAAGVYTIDASGADASLFGLGHSYYGSNRTILEDIKEVLTTNRSPLDRGLVEEQAKDGRYWRWRNAD